MNRKVYNVQETNHGNSINIGLWIDEMEKKIPGDFWVKIKNVYEEEEYLE